MSAPQPVEHRPRRLVALSARLGFPYHALSLVAVVVFAGVLLLSFGWWGGGGLMAGVVVCQLAVAGLWTFGTGSYGFPGTSVVLLVTAVAADLALFPAHRLRIGALGLVLVLGLLAAFAQQVLRRPPRRELTVSLAQTVVGVLVVEALAVLVLVERLERDHVVISATLLCVGAALVVSHVGDLLLPFPRISPDVRRGAVGLVLGIAAGATVAAIRLNATALSDVLGHVIFGGVVSTVAVLVSAAMTFVVADRAPDVIGGAVVQAVTPIAAAAPVALYVALLVA